LAPNIATAFRDGKFTVRQKSGTFNGLWTDMALENTYNRDAKPKLFIVFNHKPAAMEKYLPALPLLTAVSEQTKSMAHLDQCGTKHHEDSCSLAMKEADSVKKITPIMNNQMINPFLYEGH